MAMGRFHALIFLDTVKDITMNNSDVPYVASANRFEMLSDMTVTKSTWLAQNTTGTCKIGYALLCHDLFLLPVLTRTG